MELVGYILRVKQEMNGKTYQDTGKMMSVLAMFILTRKYKPNRIRSLF